MAISAEDVVIHSPLKGQWTIYNPPGHAALAFDLLAVDEKGSLYSGSSFFWHMFTTIEAANTLTWDQEVYAPVAGKVIAAQSDVEDRKSISFLYDIISMGINRPDPKDGFGVFGGNHVLISSNGYYVLLCHLKKGSVSVRTGDQVTVGQPIARVGNSGSSIQPHLHLQVMSTEKIFPLFENLVPFRLFEGNIRKEGQWRKEGNFSLENRGYYMF